MKRDLKTIHTEHEKRLAGFFAELDVINGNIKYYKEMAVFFPGFAKKRLEELELKRIDVEKELTEEIKKDIER